MYGRLPDYGEFHGYDLGIGSEVSRIDGNIYANFRRQSWGTLMRHLFPAVAQAKLFRHLKILAGNGKKDECVQERMFRIVAEIPMTNTFSDLVELNFVDYGGYAAFLHIHDTFSRFSVAVFIGAKKDVGHTSEMALDTAIAHGYSAFGAPDIWIVYKDMGII